MIPVPPTAYADYPLGFSLPATLMIDPTFLADGYAIPDSGIPASPVLLLRMNPTSIKIRGGGNWSPPAGSTPAPAEGESASTATATTPPVVTGDVPDVKYTSPQARSMSFEILIEGDPTMVMLEMNILWGWTRPAGTITGQKSAPYLRLIWGPAIFFKCYLASIDATFEMFNTIGQATRVKVSLTLNEVKDIFPGTNPTSGGTGGEKSHTIMAGESLHSVAHAEYGRAELWRMLAEFNGIDDPLRVPPGTVVAVPPVTNVLEHL